MNKKPNFITIAVDFDGTIIKGGQYPDAKNPIPHAIDCLKRLSGSDKVRLILWSCRDHESDTAAFDNMMRFLDEQGIHFDAVNDNLKYYKDMGFACRKIFANVYIDDMVLSIKPNKSIDRFVDKEMADFWNNLYNQIINDAGRDIWVNNILNRVVLK